MALWARGCRLHEDHTVTPGTWASFYVAQRQVLTTYALALTGNEHAAEDLIQDVLVRIVQQQRPIRHARAYVLRCMHNLWIDHHRSKQRQVDTVPFENDAIAFIDTNLEGSSDCEAMQQLVDALKSLSQEEREIIVLKIYGDLKFKEISTILDQPIGTVTARYARGIKQLQELCMRVV